MASMTSFKTHSLTLSLPSELLDKWSDLNMGGSVDVTSLKAGESDVVVSLSRSMDSAKVKVTGSGNSFIECLSGNYFCELTNIHTNTITSSATETEEPNSIYDSTKLIPSENIWGSSPLHESEVCQGSDFLDKLHYDSMNTSLKSGKQKKVPEAAIIQHGIPHEKDTQSVPPNSESITIGGVKRERVPEQQTMRVNQRKSTRLKREVRDEDFVVPVKKRKIPPSLVPENEDLNIGTELKPKRGRGRPRKCLTPEEQQVDRQPETSSSVPPVTDKLEEKIPLEPGHKKDTSVESNINGQRTTRTNQAKKKSRESNKHSGTEKDKVDIKLVDTLRCILCEVIHKNKSQLKRHVKAEHDLQWGQYEKRAQTVGTQERNSTVQSSAPSYDISDATLVSWGSMQCLLCGKRWDNLTKFKNHLYTNHKTSHSEHAEVLTHADLDWRRSALNRLRADSERHMRLSGRHCPVCLSVQLDRDQLLRHITTHKDLADYQKYVAEFSRQAEDSKGLRSISQRNCRKPKTNKIQSQIEDDKLDDTTDITCCICSRSYDSGLALRRHINSSHAMSWVEYMVLLNLPAGEQAKKVKTIALSKNHPKKKCLDADGQVIQCLSCVEMVPCKDYRDHLETDHPDVENVDGTIAKMETVVINTSYQAINAFSITCPICQDTVSVNSVQKHFKNRHKKHPDWEIKLAVVQSEIRQKANYNRSRARAERSALGVKYSCQHCGINFQDKSSRSAHMNYQCTKNEGRKQSYTCKYCGQKGTSEKWYEDHIKRHDPVGNNYVCSICGKGYLNRSGLQTHVARVHHNVVKFSCDVCDKKFYVKSHYENHVLKHSSVRKYSCEVCKKWFKNPVCVRRHIRLMHENPDRQPGTSSTETPKQSQRCQPDLLPEQDDSLKTTDTRPKTKNKTSDSETISTSLSTVQVISTSNHTQTAQLVLLPSIPDSYPSTSSQEQNTQQWSSDMTPNDANWNKTELANNISPRSQRIPLMVAAQSVPPPTPNHGPRLVSLLANNGNFHRNMSENSEKDLHAQSPNLHPSLMEISQVAGAQQDVPVAHNPCQSLEELLPAPANIIVPDPGLLTESPELLQPSAADEISMIQEVFIDDEGNIVGTLPSVDAVSEQGVMVGSEDGNIPNFVIMKADSGDSKIDGSVLDLSSLIWITAPDKG